MGKSKFAQHACQNRVMLGTTTCHTKLTPEMLIKIPGLEFTTSFPGSLILPPGESEERPWLGLVTATLTIENTRKGSSVIRQFVALSFVAIVAFARELRQSDRKSWTEINMIFVNKTEHTVLADSSSLNSRVGRDNIERK